MNLWDLGRHQKAVISAYSPHLGEGFRQRLMDLGFVPGVSVVCLRRSLLGGPRVFQVGLSLVALEKEIAQQVVLGEAVAV